MIVSHQDILDQFQQIKKVCDRIETTTNESDAALAQQKRFQAFTELSLQATIALNRYEQLQESFIDLISDTQRGHVSTLLLPPEQLEEQAKSIQAHLPDDLSLPGGIHSGNLIDLYTAMNIKTRALENMLIFDVRIPLINSNEFQLFKIHALPVKIKNETWTIQPSTTVFLINLKRDLYYGMSENELRECKTQQHVFYCRHRHPLYKRGSSIHKCEFQIFSHQKELDPSCQFLEEKTTNKWIQLERPNQWIFSLEKNTTVDIVCNNTPYHTELTGQGIISLLQHCSIQLADLVVQSVYEIQSKITQSYMPNLDISNFLTKTNKPVNSVRNWANDATQFTNDMQNLQKRMTEIDKSATSAMNNKKWHNIHH